MPLEIKDQAFQQIGPAQERAVRRRLAAEHDMVAAAGAGVAAVDHELVGAEPAQPGLLVNRARDIDRVAPGCGRMDVDLDDTGIGRHLDHVQPRVGRRQIAFDVERQVELGGRGFDGGEKLEIALELLDRRHEHAEPALARLDRERGAHRNGLGLNGRASGRAGLEAAARRGGRSGAAVAGECARHRGRIRQCAAFGERVFRHEMRLVDRFDMRQRAERQPEADRRIARHEEQPAAAQLPKLADPAAARLRAPMLHRQHVAGRRGEMPLEFAHDAGALGRIVDLGIARVDVVRQRAFLEHPLGGILEGRQHVLGGDAEPAGRGPR